MYCVERLGGRHGRVNLEPDDLAKTFMEMVRTGMVKGLFLSSAVQKTPVSTMDRMLGTLEQVRVRHRFNGFVHIKIIPGAEEAQIARAMQLADRVSVNLEAPTEKSLAVAAPGKDFHCQLKSSMHFIARNLKRARFRCKSHTTQYVVGAGGERDREILKSLWDAYRELRLGRGYFSAFQPLRGTPLEHSAAPPLMREHRLYQTDFLFRKYGFTFDEIIFDNSENLSLSRDPKAVWAARHPNFFPLEINRAKKDELLRVPGIGPEAAAFIVKQRQQTRIGDLDGLKAATRRWRIAAPYLLFCGKRRAEASPQLSFPW